MASHPTLTTGAVTPQRAISNTGDTMRYSWIEPDDDGEPLVQVITDDEIMETYYPWWCEQMRKVGKESLISKRNCIEDFMTIHWAWEHKDK